MGDVEEKAVRHRVWVFTWNNYTEANIKHILSKFEGCEYAFQEEKGTEGTPHLQGVVRFKNSKSLKCCKKIDKAIHWKVCKNLAASKNYCCKEETRTGRQWVTFENKITETVKDPLEGVELYGWQKEIKKIIDEEPHDRRIDWYWEPDGNIGKTTFVKSCCIQRTDAIYVSGKASDVKFAIAGMKRKPRCVFWDVPRVSQDYVSYEALESIKNGIFFSNKYESGMVIYDIPHVIVFANFSPEEHKLSKDRWHVVNIAKPPSPLTL